jgi:hypothetical protein
MLEGSQGIEKMALPFSFSGTLSVPNGSRALADAIAGALESEGGRNIKISDSVITFDGITTYLRVSPLANISRGVISFHFLPQCAELTYSMIVDRGPPFMAIGLTVTGLMLTLYEQEFSFFLGLGLVILGYSLVYPFVIRYRWRRWLLDVGHRTGDLPSRPGNS